MSLLSIGVIVAILVIVLWAVAIYNRLVRLRNQTRNAFSQIDVQLKRRHDLVPNLVETARGYLKHERQTLEAVIAARPDFIVIPSRGLESIGGAAGLGAQPGVAQTGAARHVIAIDDLKLLGFGPRVGDALLELVRALHPELHGS